MRRITYFSQRLRGQRYTPHEPPYSRELIAANAAASETTTRIRLRNQPGIIPNDRVDHDGTFYNIQGVINPRSENREIVLIARLLRNLPTPEILAIFWQQGRKEKSPLRFR